MAFNKNKVMKISLIIVVVLVIILVAYIFLTTLFDFLIFELKKVKMDKDNYEELLNKKHYMNVLPDYFSSAKGTGNCYFYKYKNNSEILIMELHQYSEIKINEINIKNYLLKKENKNSKKLRIGIERHSKHYLFIDLYPKFKKAKNLGFYIGPKIEFKKEGKNFLYLKFIESYFSISSIEEYRELDFLFSTKDFPIVLLIMKYQGRTLFIVKYKIEPNEKDDDNNTLLDLINTDNL